MRSACAAIVLCWAAASSAKAPPSAAELARVLPAKLGGIARTGAIDKVDNPGGGNHVAHAAYLDMRARKSINVNISTVVDPPAQFNRFGRDGEVSKTAVAEHRGCHVKGFPAETVRSDLTPDKSEVVVMLRDKIEVNVEIQPAADPDEAARVAAELDLAALDKIAAAH